MAVMARKPEKNPIERACIAAGSQSRLAELVGVTPQAVSKWLRTGSVPAERVLAVEAASAGAVSRYDLRPDIYPRAA